MSSAADPGPGSCVFVRPPLSATDPSFGSAFTPPQVVSGKLTLPDPLDVLEHCGLEFPAKIESSSVAAPAIAPPEPGGFPVPKLLPVTVTCEIVNPDAMGEAL